MKHFGWKKRNFPGKQRKTYNFPKGRMSRFALAFRRKYRKVEIIQFYQRVFGQESPSPTAISRWISRASPPPQWRWSLPPTNRIESDLSAVESEDERGPPSLPDTVHLSDLSAGESADEWGQIREE